MTGTGGETHQRGPENTVPGDTWDELGFLGKSAAAAAAATATTGSGEGSVRRSGFDLDDGVWDGDDSVGGLAEVTVAPKAGLGWRVAAPPLGSSTTSTTDTWASPASIMYQSTDPTSSTSRAQDLPRALLLELYALWPANVIRLARDPATYLIEHAVESPYAVPWAEVWRKREVVELLAVSPGSLHPRARNPHSRFPRWQTALRGFLFNPAILLADASQEITDTSRFARTQTSESIAQGHALWLGNIIPSIDNAGGLLSSARVRERNAEGMGAGERMASPTDTALSSSGGSVQGRYHSGRTQAHRGAVAQGGGGAAATTSTAAQGNYISSQTAPINIRAMGIKGHHHVGGEKGTGGNTGGGENLQAEVDGLRREKEFLEMDLRYAKTLAGSYLQRESADWIGEIKV